MTGRILDPDGDNRDGGPESIFTGVLDVKPRLIHAPRDRERERKRHNKQGDGSAR